LLRRRLVAAAIALGMAVGIGTALQGALGVTGGGPLSTTGVPGGVAQLAGQRVWVVAPGDTVWAIATAVSGNRDVRPLVDRLVAETGGRPLQVGQRLPLP
jgi:hypothetical protein